MSDPIDDIIAREGAYSNNSADSGGPTMYGISTPVLSEWLGRPATIDDVKNLTKDVAHQIYTQKYLTKPHIDQLPENLIPMVLDIAVNSGPGNAIKMLQRVINEAGFGPVAVDGGLGPATLAAVSTANSQMGVYLNNAIVDERENFYKSIVQSNPSQGEFLKGWLNRAEGFRLAVPEDYTPSASS